MHRKAAVLLVVVAIALALTGCGGGEQGLEHGKVALLCSDLNWGVLGNTFTLAVEEYNARGEGIPIELIHIATGNDTDPAGWFTPETEAAAMQQAIADPEVILALGGASDDMARGGLPVANEARLAYMTFGAMWAGFTQPGYAPGEPGIFYPTGERNFFRLATRDDQVARLMVDFIQEELGDVDSVYLTYWPVIGGLAGQVELAVSDADMELVGYEETGQGVGVAATITDEDRAQAQRIVDAAPDVLILPPNPGLIYAVRELDPNLPIVGWILTSVSFTQPPEGHTLAELEGIYEQEWASNPTNFDVEAWESFAARHEARFGSPVTPGFEGQAAFQWDGIELALRDIEQMDVVTREGVSQAIYNYSGYSGILGSWHYTPEGDMSFATCAFSQLQDGAWVTVDFIREETD